MTAANAPVSFESLAQITHPSSAMEWEVKRVGDKWKLEVLPDFSSLHGSLLGYNLDDITSRSPETAWPAIYPG